MHDIAVIGAGRIGRIHARNAVAEPRLRLRYVIDPVADAAAAAAAETGAATATLDEALANPAIAGVVGVIALPATHKAAPSRAAALQLSAAQAADDEPADRRAFFGELHLHTGQSFDAYSMMGARSERRNPSVRAVPALHRGRPRRYR